MARTDETEVRSVFSETADGTAMDGVAVSFYIEAANDVVTAHLDGKGLAADALQRIEALVACHLIAASDPTEDEGSIGDESTTFEGADLGDYGFRETRFGRRAITLDTTGTLGTVGKGEASSFTFNGADYDSQGGTNLTD